MKKTPITDAESYYIRAEEAKKALLGAISNSDNVHGAYAFIADALAYALTSDFYKEEESRSELQNNYFGIKYILECCLEVSEAEKLVALLESVRKDKAA